MELTLNTIYVKSEYEDDFWYKLLSVLESTLTDKTLQLQHKEKEVLTFILQGDPFKDYFRGEYRQELLKRFKMANSQLSSLRSSMNKKGWLDEMFVTSSIRNLQKQIKKMQESGNEEVSVKISFVLKLKENEGNT